MKNWLKKLILGGSCSFPCIFAQCIRDIFKTFQFSCLKSLNHTSSCGKTQLGTDLPHHLRAQGPGTVELSSYPAEDTHHVIPISKGSKGQNKRVGHKHEKTKTDKKHEEWKLTKPGWLRLCGCGLAGAAGLHFFEARSGPGTCWACASTGRWSGRITGRLRGCVGLTALEIFSFDTMCWHNVMTMIRSNPVLDAFVWVSAALATRLGKKAQNTRNHKHHAVNDGDSCDLCLLTLLSVQLNVCPMPWS